jgi:MFS family permease
LEKIGGVTYAVPALAEIEASLVHGTGKIDLRILTESKIRRILSLGIVLAVFQQWCGINVIFNYAEEVFSAAGYQVSDILFNIVITGTVNLLFTLVAFALVDKFGRRILMLLGAAGLAVIYTLLGLCYAAQSQGIHVLALVVAPVTWVVISEIFPNRIRGTAMSIAVAFLWIACFILTYTFPILNRMIGAAGTFWIYAGICLAGFFFLLFRLPETRGKSLESIELDLNQN